MKTGRGRLTTGSAAGISTITIAGVGHVGMTLASAWMIRGTGKTLALHGRDAENVRAAALDPQHRLQFVPMADGGRLR